MYLKKKYVIPIILGLITLCGCSEIGNKSISPSSIYIVTTIMSFIAGIIYCSTIKSKSVWFLLMFASIFIVNIGYLSLSISTVLEEALLANRIAYFGSVFLPLSLFMSILEMLKIKHPKWLSYVLVSLSIFIFLVAASPGYLDIYYQDVTLDIINGTAILRKVYGPWHSIYLFYLLGYFASMIIVVLYTERIKHVTSQIDAFFLLTAVFVNIGVWY